jgi:hypothetical protein
MQGQGGHVRSKDDLFCPGSPQKICRHLPGLIDNGIRFAAGGKNPAVVGIRLDQILLNAVDGSLGNLRPGRVIKKNCWASQPRKMAANTIHV